MDPILFGRKLTDKEVTEIIKEMQNSPAGIVTASENPIKELKHKKGIPTVIEYQGRRYVLDYVNNRK